MNALRSQKFYSLKGEFGCQKRRKKFALGSAKVRASIDHNTYFYVIKANKKNHFTDVSDKINNALVTFFADKKRFLEITAATGIKIIVGRRGDIFLGKTNPLEKCVDN